jgi:diacylglycerol kinase (ATP)
LALHEPPEAQRTPPDAGERVVAPRPHLWRILRSFGYAFEGLATIVRTQPNFWVHSIAAVLALLLGVVLHLSPGELAVLALTIVVVLVAEAINTVIETICDLVEPRTNPLVKRAKDVSAAAVLIAALGAVGVALLLFAPRLIALGR